MEAMNENLKQSFDLISNNCLQTIIALIIIWFTFKVYRFWTFNKLHLVFKPCLYLFDNTLKKIVNHVEFIDYIQILIDYNLKHL